MAGESKTSGFVHLAAVLKIGSNDDERYPQQDARHNLDQLWYIHAEEVGEGENAGNAGDTVGDDVCLEWLALYRAIDEPADETQ